MIFPKKQEVVWYPRRVLVPSQLYFDVSCACLIVLMARLACQLVSQFFDGDAFLLLVSQSCDDDGP